MTNAFAKGSFDLAFGANGIQSLDHEQPVLLMMPGILKRRRHHYVRHGTTSRWQRSTSPRAFHR